MQALKTNILLFTLLFVSIVLFGCAHGDLDVRVESLAFQEKSKINMEVILILNNEFRNAKWVDISAESGWEAHVVYLGENFVINTKKLANSLFARVVVVDSFDQALKIQSDSILKPTMIAVEKNRPLWATDDSTMTVALEWTLTDMNSNPIWVNTILGEGTAGITDDEKRLKLLIDDLFTKSYSEISSSPEIANYEKDIKGRD